MIKKLLRMWRPPTPGETAVSIIPEIKPLAECFPLEGLLKSARELFEDEVLTFAASFLASNPSLIDSLKIDRAKKKCVREKICGPIIESECEFTIYDIQRECLCYHPSLADRKIVRRHLDSEVQIGELEKESKGRVLVYVWRRDFEDR